MVHALGLFIHRFFFREARNIYIYYKYLSLRENNATHVFYKFIHT